MAKKDTFISSASSFIKEHENELPESLNVLGGVTFGFMNALAECPDCPCVLRIPDNEDWDHLYCPSCKNIWTHKSLISK